MDYIVIIQRKLECNKVIVRSEKQVRSVVAVMETNRPCCSSATDDSPSDVARTSPETPSSAVRSLPNTGGPRPGFVPSLFSLSKSKETILSLYSSCLLLLGANSSRMFAFFLFLHKQAGQD